MSRQNCSVIFLTLALVFADAGRAADDFLLRGFVEHAVSEGVSQVVNGQAISRLYTGRQYQPLWFGSGPLSAHRETLLKEIEASREHGFDPANYHYPALRVGDLPEEIQDVLLSDALLSQIQHRVSGVVDRRSIGSSQDHWLIEPDGQTPAANIDAILEKPATLEETLRTLWPEHPDYWRLLEKRATLATQEIASQQPLVLGRLLKPGMVGEDIVALKTRLWGNADVHSNQFDSQLESAIKVLQLEAGLEADGMVGGATLAIFNASPQSRVEQIDANLERWRWLPREVPEQHIRVNIASYRLRVFEKQTPVLSMDVIVGRPYRQTPVFTETIKYLVFNPFWNVPPSIANKDKLPLLKSDPDALAMLGYEAKLADNGDFVSVGEVNWQAMRAGQFNLRQRPGEKNALGKVKFMLPNPHSIYLHDTPDKQLFAKTERLFSSGCIRLADPRALAAWILGRESNPQAVQLDSLFLSSTTTTVYLTKPVPVYLVYFTVFTDDDGRVVFRRDGYNRDQAIIDALHRNSNNHKGARPS